MEPSSLCRALRDQIIPWIERWGMQRIVVAAGSYEELKARDESLPEGMTMEPRPWRGKRQAMRSSRVYGSAGVVNAKWPDDNLQTTRTPKLCFILRGAISYPVGDYQLKCQAGHGILLPPGVPFALEIKPEYIDFRFGGKQCEIFQLLPYQSSLNCWISTKALDARGKFSNNADVVSVVHSKASEYLKSVTGEALKREPFYEIMCKSWLQLLTHELYRELEEALVIRTKRRGALIMGAGSQHLDLENVPERAGETPIVLAQKYIRQNLALDLSIDSVADYICMSRSVFTEKFRQHSGMSFTEYVTQQRLQEAETLLKETDLSILQISKTVGVTTAWLRKLFQQQFSLSPTQFRKHYQQGTLVLK